MLEWIGNLIDALARQQDGYNTPRSSSGNRSSLDPQLRKLFRDELNRFGTLYSQAAEEAIRAGAAKSDADAQQFRQRMGDLGRGLLLKVFITIAESHTRWTPEEFDLARDLIRFVWGTSLSGAELRVALENVVHHTQTLSWESLLRPFLTTPVLRRRALELEPIIHRLANLVAKADGSVSPAEYGGLQALQHHIGDQLAALRDPQPKNPADILRQGQAIALAIQPKPADGAASGASSVAAKPAPSDAKTHAAPAKAPAEILAEALCELDQLVGLASVKREVRELADFLKMQQERQRMDLPATSVTLHTLFTGNPGTGKTTVARIMGRILVGLGILKQGHTIETDRSGLVAQYAGQTGPKTNELINTALDGVLFVDEAYSLVSENEQDAYGAEAVQALLKRMEDDRNRLVVVLAGYPDPMASLIGSNPGLSSRFQRTIHFPDYSAKELEQIFLGLCQQNHYHLTRPALTRLRLGLAEAVENRDEHFGNARLVRNLFERAIRRMAARIAGIAPLTRELLTTLEPSDLVFAED